MPSFADMERVLENLDHRLHDVEQLLPTLAKKADLDRFATKADLERFATKEDLQQFATKKDLQQFATKVELRETAGTLTRHTDMRFEDLRDDIAKVAEGVAAVSSTLQTQQQTLAVVVTRLDRHEDVLNALVRKLGI
jgi:hypothetical protein